MVIKKAHASETWARPSEVPVGEYNHQYYLNNLNFTYCHFNLQGTKKFLDRFYEPTP